MDIIQNTVFVSGYWQVEGNQKRSHSEYLINLSNTLEIIKGRNLIFYTSEDGMVHHVQKLCKQHGVSVEFKHSIIAGLPAAQHAQHFVQEAQKMNIDNLHFLTLPAKEKGLAHYKRDLIPSALVYEQLLTIWLSKIHLIAGNLSNAPYYAWIDSGFSRFNYKRQNWNLRRIKPNDGRILHYGSLMSFYGKNLPLNASFLLGDKKHWGKLSFEFEKCLELFKSIPYPIDEEVVLAEVLTRNPDLFHQIGMPYKLNTQIKRSIHWQYLKVMRILEKIRI